MKLARKLQKRRGFTLTELLIVVAIIALLAGIAFLFVDPQTIYHVEYDRNAESIATALQNRFAEMRTAGQLDSLLTVGEKATPKNSIISGASLSTDSGDEGGYRYLFSYDVVDEEGNVVKNKDMSDWLPFGSLESDVAAGYYAVGFYANTGSVGQVFWSQEKFKARTTDYLNNLANDLARRKTDKVGYYEGSVDSGDVAFAQLPTPQLTITNYEQLTLSIYLPEVQELKALNKVLGLRISMADEDLNAYKGGLTYDDTAIYKTYGTGTNVMSQTVQMGETYKLILDTPNNEFYPVELNNKVILSETPSGTFEEWAQRTAAFSKGYIKLGDNVQVAVTVFCVSGGEGTNQVIDPTYMPRSGSVTFNGWFQNYGSSSVDIACGRHLQNLAKLTEPNSAFNEKWLPTKELQPDGTYKYSDVSRGKGYFYTDDAGDEEISKKYKYRKCVKEITQANQVMAIDFQCKDWMKDGATVDYDHQILFEPINLPSGFTYAGNYLTIKHLKVDAPFYAGLFGYVYKDNLYNILLVNPSVKSRMTAYISQVYEMGVGALIGTSRDSDHIYNCQAYMEKEQNTVQPDATNFPYRVEGEGYVGGLIGFCEDEKIQQNSASVYVGKADSSSRYVGGLIGCITGDASVLYSYAAGNLRGQYVGGLIGLLLEDTDNTGDDYTVNGCYTAGHIERATQSASGLIGYIDEQGGYTKSALCVYQNYCAIIYGKGNGLPTDWEDSKITKYTYQADGTVTSVETDAPTPIYGTFEGDGFKWLSWDESYLTGSYSSTYEVTEEGETVQKTITSPTFFLGAGFNDENDNYYFPQKGITYSNSEYFESMKSVTQTFLDAIKGKTDKTTIENAADTFSKQIRRLKLLQTLDEMKKGYERMLEELHQETAKDSSGRAYTEGGYQHDKDCQGKISLSQERASARLSGGKAQEESIEVTMLQALELIYDGEYGGTTATLNYKGSTSDAKWYAINTTPDNREYNTIFIDYTFTGIYEKLKSALEDYYKDDDGSINTENAAIVQQFIGIDLEGNRYRKSDQEFPVQGGLLCRFLYNNLVYPVIHYSQNYYEKFKKDAVGAAMYNYFYERFVKTRLNNYIYSMGTESSTLQDALLLQKQKNVNNAIATLNDVKNAVAQWKTFKYEESHYEAKALNADRYQSEMQALIDKASTALSALQTALNNYSVTSYGDLEKFTDDANAALKAIYNYYDTKIDVDIKEGHEEKGRAPKKAIALKEFTGIVDGSGKEGTLRTLRDPLDSDRSKVKKSAVVLNSGPEGAMDRLLHDIGAGVPIADAVTTCVTSLNNCLGTDWEGRDSGHRIYSATELRNIRHDEKTDESHLSGEFIYRYDDGSPYGDFVNKHAYIDKDNGIYNNVFPYTEKGKLTRYYPYLMVKGYKYDDKNRWTYMLFHYGDWLTADMIADEPAGGHKYHIQKSPEEQQKELLQSVSAGR